MGHRLLLCAGTLLVACSTPPRQLPADAGPRQDLELQPADGTAPADAAVDLPAPVCPTTPQVELIEPNSSVGAIWAAPDGQHAAALVNFNWTTGVGDLRVIDLAAQKSQLAATGIAPAGARFLADSSAFAYFTFDKIVTGGEPVWSLNLFDLAGKASHEVADGVVDVKYSDDGKQIAYHTPDETYLYDVSADKAAVVDQGSKPCFLDPSWEMGFACYPLTFSKSGRLFFVADLKQAVVNNIAGVAGTLASVKLSAPDKADVYASGVSEYLVFAEGKVIAYANNWVFDQDNNYRGDLTVRQVEGAFSKKVLTNALYASPSEHVDVAPDGSSLVHSNPNISPTTFTLVKIPAGTTVWVEDEVPYSYAPTQTRCRPFYLGKDHVIVGKQLWTGSKIDLAYDLVSTSDQTVRTRLGEMVRRLGFDVDRPLLALTQYPKSATKYDGPAVLKSWSLQGGVAKQAKQLTLSSPPVSIHQQFDKSGERIALLVDYHDNWRGQLVLGLLDTGVVKQISTTKDAHAPSWIADRSYLVYLEDAAPSVPGSLSAITEPFTTTPHQVGTSVHTYVELPGDCPALLFTDCAIPHIDIKACGAVSPGVYRVTLPAAAY
jgi:hypothetical protein